MNLEEANRLCALLAGSYPAAKWTDHSPEAYLTFLARYPFQLVLDATMRACEESPAFCPSAPSIAAVLLTAREGTAEAEWASVKSQITNRGWYRGPAEDNGPITASTITAIGWQVLCEYDLTKETFMRTMFIDTWRGIAAQQRRTELSRALLDASEPAIPEEL